MRVCKVDALSSRVLAVTITNSIPASTAGSNDASGTVRVHGTNVSLYNLNIANTFGQGVYLPTLLQIHVLMHLRSRRLLL